MTAQTILDSTKPLLTGLKVAEDDNTLLIYLNMAKNQIAQDTLSWLGGEEITMTTDSDYTLSKIPIQILDVYKEPNIVLRRNVLDVNGYFQTSPNTIKIISPEDGNKVYLNYYYTPPDFILTDEVVIPQSLINSTQYFIAHKCFENYKTEKEMFSSTEYYKKYKASVVEYINSTDALSSDILLQEDMIKMKGLV